MESLLRAFGQQTTHIGDLALNHVASFLVEHPHRLSDLLNGSNVRVWTKENMLKLGLLLVHLLDGLAFALGLF
jgi:hypothetical protein